MNTVRNVLRNSKLLLSLVTAVSPSKSPQLFRVVPKKLRRLEGDTATRPLLRRFDCVSSRGFSDLFVRCTCRHPSSKHFRRRRLCRRLPRRLPRSKSVKGVLRVWRPCATQRWSGPCACIGARSSSVRGTCSSRAPTLRHGMLASSDTACVKGGTAARRPFSAPSIVTPKPHVDLCGRTRLAFACSLRSMSAPPPTLSQTVTLSQRPSDFATVDSQVARVSRAGLSVLGGYGDAAASAVCSNPACSLSR